MHWFMTNMWFWIFILILHASLCLYYAELAICQWLYQWIRMMCYIYALSCDMWQEWAHGLILWDVWSLVVTHYATLCQSYLIYDHLVYWLYFFLEHLIVRSVIRHMHSVRRWLSVELSLTVAGHSVKLLIRHTLLISTTLTT
jgi:hypothetical protein